jgi:hypothetical protein
MARDAYTGPVSPNDDIEALWLQIAVAAQAAGAVVNLNTIETRTPVPQEAHYNILRFAYAMRLSSGVTTTTPGDLLTGPVSINNSDHDLLVKAAYALRLQAAITTTAPGDLLTGPVSANNTTHELLVKIAYAIRDIAAITTTAPGDLLTTPVSENMSDHDLLVKIAYAFQVVT